MKDDSKVSLTLSSTALTVLEKHASPRRRGELVSRLLLAYGAGEGGIDTVDVEGVKLQMLGLSSANKTLEGRVLRLERQVSAMMAGVK